MANSCSISWGFLSDTKISEDWIIPLAPTMIIAGPEDILEDGVVNHQVQRDRGRGQVANISVVEEATGLRKKDWQNHWHLASFES